MEIENEDGMNFIERLLFIVFQITNWLQKQCLFIS